MDEAELNTPNIVSRQHLIEAIVGMTLLVLAFFAIASSDVSATGTRTYWSLLILVFAVTAFASDRIHTGHSFGHLPSALTIFLHWLGIFAAIQIVHYLVATDRMANADIGLTNGLVLALGTYLFGLYSNWRMAVIGFALALGTAGVAFIEEFVWFLFIVAVVAILILFFGAKLIKSH
ncbi:MAG: hypothetical protein KDI33_08015 [Halioglobus sp.]|nr:hypothetical protein [Halioglobus sp.]